MEKTTRDRLTGAVIFFAALIVLVPELLSRSGPKPDGGQVVADPSAPPLTTYDLSIHPATAPTSAGQQELAVAESGSESEAIAIAVPPPVTQSATVSRAAPEEAPPAQAAVPSPAPVQAPSPTAPRSAAATPATPPQAAAAASGKYWVQIGVYASADNVRRLVQELQGKGFATEVAGIRSGGRDLQRVRVGPVADRAAALELQKRLAAAGREGPVVGP